MSFLSTGALWFFFMIPPVVLLYLLKVKREEKEISSTLLWQQVLNDLAANTPFQRLRKNILMFLQILLLAAIVFSLIRPVVKGESRPAASTVIVIDCSGSMNAVGEGGTRLEVAKQEALKLLTSVSPGKHNEFMIIAAARDVRTLSQFTDDTSLLAGRIRALQPTELTGNITDALSIAASAIKGRNDATVYLLTDGCLEKELPDMAALSGRLNAIQVGKPQQNIAIVNLAAEDLERDGAKEVFVSVKNHSDTEQTTLLSVYDGTDLVDVREMVLPPFETKSRSFIMLPASEIMRCEIDAEDALAADNRAYLQVAREKDTEVLLVSTGGIFVAKALANMENMSLSIAGPTDYGESMALSPDVIIFDGYVPAKLPEKRCVFICPPGDLGPVSFGGTVESLIVTDYQREDPLFRFVSLDDLYVSEMRKIANPASISALASSKGIPAMGNFAVGTTEHFLICFDLSKSEWAVRPSFPMFVSNLVESVAAVNRMISSANISVGDVIEVNKKSEGERVSVAYPDGRREEIQSTERSVKFYDTDRSGLYTFSVGETERTVAVSFLNDEESDVFHVRDLSRDTANVSVASSVKSVNREIWKYFVLGAFVVGMVEWVCFHRKIQ